MEWLYDKFEIDRRWCLIHATHVSPDEVHMMGHSEAVVGLCPTTEANLGDGIFPAQEFLASNGAFGIGSDSHVSVSALEELRWLEYGQRLKHERRNRLSARQPAGGGGHALHRGAAGRRAGDGPAHRLASRPASAPISWCSTARTRCWRNVAPAKLLARWLFGGNDGWVKDVMVGGKWVVKDRHHAGEEAAHQAFSAAMSALMAACAIALPSRRLAPRP